MNKKIYIVAFLIRIIFATKIVIPAYPTYQEIRIKKFNELRNLKSYKMRKGKTYSNVNIKQITIFFPLKTSSNLVEFQKSF